MSSVLDSSVPLTSLPTRVHPRARKIAVVAWLRKWHAWIGLWGAILGLCFGVTGILMNHRAILKIPVNKGEQRTVQLKLGERNFGSAPEMATWLQSELKFDRPATRIKIEKPTTLNFGGMSVQQPERWLFNFAHPTRSANLEYFVGNRTVKADAFDATLIGTMTRLHMSVGVDAFWVLLMDSIAGSLILLSLSGLALWFGTRGVRKTSLAVGGMAALLVAAWLAVSI